MATFQIGAAIFTFRLLLDGAEHSRPSAVNLRHIPGGNVNYIDNGGLEAPVLRCRVQLTSFNDLVLLQALQGQVGTLTWSEAIYTGAVLRSVTRARAMGRGDVNLANLEFILDADTATIPGA